MGIVKVFCKLREARELVKGSSRDACLDFVIEAADAPHVRI